MTPYYLDASAWVKRHQREAGSDWIDRLWTPPVRFACASLGLVEVLCTIARRNAAHHTPQAARDVIFRAARADFDAFIQIDLDASILREAEMLARRQALRGADCIHLASAIGLRNRMGAPVTLIASDTELLAAAAAEGFPTLDPNLNPPIPASS